MQDSKVYRGLGLPGLLALSVMSACWLAPAARATTSLDHTIPRAKVARVGMDTDERTTAASPCLKIREQFDFVGRYYSSYTKIATKIITLEEAQALSNNALGIGMFYEDRPLGYYYYSEKRGGHDGRHAYDYASGTIGQPSSTIYFTVDYDASQHQIDHRLTQYFHGVHEALQDREIKHPGGPVYEIGVYAGSRACKSLKGLTWNGKTIVTSAWLASGMHDGIKWYDWNVLQKLGKIYESMQCDPDEAPGLTAGGFDLAVTAPAGTCN